MTAAKWAATALLLGSACSVQIDNPNAIDCDGTHPCPGGSSCVGGVCILPPGPLPAFPEAQGGGAASVGGRGGQVIEVTNLNDTGAGSLRACVDASGPRTCVFRVAGVIPVQTALLVSNPYLTIAGQTAPGGGILLGGADGGGEALRVSTHDVVVRYVTCSTDTPSVAPGSGGSLCFEVVNGDNHDIVFDHVTARWAGNRLWGTLSDYVGPNHDITLQWSLLYEPNQVHPYGPSTDANPTCTPAPSCATALTDAGYCFSPCETNIDFHHDVFVNIGKAVPETSNASTRLVNDLTYNWSTYAAEFLGAEQIDVIGSEWKTANLNAGNSQPHELHFSSASSFLPGAPSIYLANDVGPSQPNPNGDPYAMAQEVSGEGGGEVGPIDAGWRRAMPMPDTAFPIVADDVTMLDGIVLATAGDSQRLDCDGGWVLKRSANDERVIAEIQNGSGGALFSGTPADDAIDPGQLCGEARSDGIPDAWKAIYGLDATDGTLGSTVSPNGYTYLECYLDGIPPTGVPITPGRYYAGCGCAAADAPVGLLATLAVLGSRRRRLRGRG